MLQSPHSGKGVVVTLESASLLLKGRYELGTLIGEGGLAAVYRARDANLGRDVAVKVFRHSANADDVFTRQEAEVNLLATLAHPGVVTLLDAAVDKSSAGSTRIYYVMELVEGRDLRARLDEGPLPPRQVAQLGADIAEALEYVHHRGVVHRDIKPANILLGDYLDDGGMRAKLTDFGIATVGGSDPLTDEDVVTGTAAYLSPEQASGAAVEVSTDVYSLGLVLLQCLTGRLPFDGPPEHAALARLLTDPEVPEELSEEWRVLISAMTSREPAERPTATEVVRALRERFGAESGRHALDTPDEERLERIAALAARVLQARGAVLTIETPDRTVTIVHGLEGRRLSAVEPAALTDSLVAASVGLGFCVNAHVIDADGQTIGTLCVLGDEPRALTDEERHTLDDLAAMVTG
jgi:serine/threonine protein kinase